MGGLDAIKELADVDGVDFDTKDENGRTLIQVARDCYNDDVLNYLVQRKMNSLVGIAAFEVAKYLQNTGDVEALEIPQTLKPLVAEFVSNN